jgi:hypothetical protein
VPFSFSTAAIEDAARGHALFPLPTIPNFSRLPDADKHKPKPKHRAFAFRRLLPTVIE